MAILAGLSFVSLGIINQAKYNAATTELNNQMSSLWIKTKALSEAKNEDYPLGIFIRKNTDSTDDVKDGSYQILLGYVGDGSFLYKLNDGKLAVETVLPSIVDIKYIPSDDSQKHTLVRPKSDTDIKDWILIQFNKSDGSVKYGAGTYEIVYKGETVMSVYLDPITGNHYIK